MEVCYRDAETKAVVKGRCALKTGNKKEKEENQCLDEAKAPSHIVGQGIR